MGQRNSGRSDGTGGGMPTSKSSTRQVNAPRGGENFKVRTGTGDDNRAKGAPTKALGVNPGSSIPGVPNGGPANQSTISKISGYTLGPVEHGGPAGAPYHNVNSYGDPGTNKPGRNSDPTDTKNR